MTTKRDYTVQMWDDSWYLDKFTRHECCSCSLTHDVEYKVEKGRIFTRWKVNDAETKKQRKALGIKVKRGNTESKA